MAAFQSLAALPQSAVILRSASQMSFVAASSVGKCPRILMILRSCELIFSMAFVVYITLRMSGGNAKNGITRSEALRQARIRRAVGLIRLRAGYRVDPV